MTTAAAPTLAPPDSTTCLPTPAARADPRPPRDPPTSNLRAPHYLSTSRLPPPATFTLAPPTSTTHLPTPAARAGHPAATSDLRTSRDPGLPAATAPSLTTPDPASPDLRAPRHLPTSALAPLTSGTPTRPDSSDHTPTSDLRVRSRHPMFVTRADLRGPRDPSTSGARLSLAVASSDLTGPPGPGNMGLLRRLGLGLRNTPEPVSRLGTQGLGRPAFARTITPSRTPSRTAERLPRNATRPAAPHAPRTIRTGRPAPQSPVTTPRTPPCTRLHPMPGRRNRRARKVSLGCLGLSLRNGGNVH